MPPSIFTVGQKVNRIEQRDITGATVLTIIERDDGNIIEIGYDEGTGCGWWPETSLLPIPAEPPTLQG